MQFVKVFLGPSAWGVTVHKLYAVYTCMGFMIDLLWCVCLQFRIVATKPKKVKFCCVVWHGIITVLKTFRGMRPAVVVIDKIWNFLCTCSYMCMFICRLRGPVRWDPLEMFQKLIHIKLQMLEVMEMHQCEWEHKGVLKECQ